MVFIEPTPYIMDLLEKGFSHIKNQMDIIFLSENLTQQWILKSYSFSFQVVRSRKKIFQLLLDVFIKRKYQLLHLAGWSKPLILFLILMSRFFFLSVTVESDTPLKKNLPLIKKIIKKCLYPILFKFPARFLPGGTRQAKYLSHYGVKNKKIINVQMTVDVEYINNYVNNIDALVREEVRLKNGAINNDIVFLFVGRLLKLKGIQELISAIQLIQDYRVKLWIVGDGYLIDEVQKATQEYKKIKYLSSVGGDDLWSTYHAADVFVLPSDGDNWGLVVNEAMAAGKPVIVSDRVGCVDDLVTHGREGLIIQSRNVNSIFQAVNFMLSNPEKRREMGKHAVERIAHWTLKNEANNMMMAWEKSGWKKNAYS